MSQHLKTAFELLTPEQQDEANKARGAILVSPEHTDRHLRRQHFPRRIVERDSAIPDLLKADAREKALEQEILTKQAEMAGIKDAAIQRQDAWDSLNAARAVLAARIGILDSRLNHYQNEEAEASRQLAFYLGVPDGGHESGERLHNLAIQIAKARIDIEIGTPELAKAEEQLAQKDSEIAEFKKKHGIQS